VNNRETLACEVAGIFTHKLHIDVPAYDSDLFETGALDSLQLVELLFELEQQFGVRISLGDSDLADFRSIERITLMLTKKNGNGSR
jgi:D-alanine--poly(phosphoribitol) ligase subunit 2